MLTVFTLCGLPGLLVWTGWSGSGGVGLFSGLLFPTIHTVCAHCHTACLCTPPACSSAHPAGVHSSVSNKWRVEGHSHFVTFLMVGVCPTMFREVGDVMTDATGFSIAPLLLFLFRSHFLTYATMCVCDSDYLTSLYA